MSATAAAAFRATVAAAGFVLDVPVIGAAEAAERVLAHWADGAELRALPDGRWLLVLAEPVEARADRAPGLPVRRLPGGGLAAVGAEGAPVPTGRLALPVAGAVATHPIAELPPLDPSDWLDPAGLTLHRLAPVGAVAEPAPVVEDLPRPARPDLRAAAGVGARSERARRLTEAAPPGGGRRVRLPGLSRAARWFGRLRLPRWGDGSGPVAFMAAAVLIVVVAVFLVVRFAQLIVDRGFHPGGVLFAVAVTALLARGSWAARGTSAGTAGTGGSAARPAGGRPVRARRPLLRGLLARLVVRSPAGRLVHGRHARYLRELTRAFEQRRWDDALRDALRLAGESRPTEQGWLSLGLPRRFAGALRPTPVTGGPAGVSPMSGPTVQQHLAGLYRQAATALEQEGRIDEAAFVLADLLDAPAEAVALLDRHGRTAQAAELAEGRGLAADLVVRLWWRAGERGRAVRTAHRRAAFADAVERLSADDPGAGRELRAAWVEHCRAGGDRLGAVEAAWPDEELRPSVAADLRDAVALGGPARGRALAHLLALGAGEATRALALAVLEDAGDDTGTTDDAGVTDAGRGRATGRSALAGALAGLPGADPANDRELATAALRAVVRDGGFGGAGGSGAPLDQRTETALFEQLAKRADPLVAADLPRPRRPARPTADAGHEWAFVDRPGTLPVLDAARLESGLLLVACGQAGVRLLGPDGRVKARWDVPADELVLADHGGAALLVARYGQVREISRLDLGTRAVRYWGTVRVHGLVPSFDGRQLLTRDEEGIAVLDTLAARPTVVWRELGGEQRPVGPLVRTPTSCASVVASRLPGGGVLTELWRWDQPGWELRSRTALEADLLGEGTALLATGRLLTGQPDPARGSTTLRWSTDREPVERLVDGVAPAGPVVDGEHWALTLAPAADGTVRVPTGTASEADPPRTLLLPNATAAGQPGAGLPAVGLRHHGGALTFWHRSGRVLATTADGSAVLANLRVTTG
ncbi:bpX6 domain-containing protein [Kitasatospora sp. NBC_01246]|uniref:bpX6 domain-containing protein n=1 Tax=Kitasatospora sp. NBC_01246 TaxID=2903570 RepID=UPI002E36570B|nr:bpX6 domain-containing protein [Kitasatospora sp. NBC_01246]